MSNKFIEIPVSEKAIARRKPTLGVGVNDAPHQIYSKTNGSQTFCPYYKKWHSMLNRCYSNKYHERQPTYKDCYVCDEWLTFSVFKAWMINQDWENNDLDKDIINPGNKLYSPENCCLVPRSINNLLCDHKAARGKYPQGVYKDAERNSYKAEISIGGRSKFLGRFPTVSGALTKYINVKVGIILKAADEQDDDRIAKGLRLHAKKISDITT